MDELLRRDMPKEGKRMDDAATIQDAIDALAPLPGDMRLGATKTVLHGKKRVVQDEAPLSHPSSELAIATPVQNFRGEWAVSDGQEGVCKFSGKAAELPQAADEARENRAEVEGPVSENKPTKPVDGATGFDVHNRDANAVG